MKEKGSRILPPVNGHPQSSALTTNFLDKTELDEDGHSQSSNSKQRTMAADPNLSRKSESLGQELTSRSSQASPSPSQVSFETKNHRNMVLPKPKSILVKRSVSEGPPNKGHDHEPSQYRQSSLSLRRASGDKNNNLSIRGKESFTKSLAGRSVQIQSATSPIMNADLSEQEEAPVASPSSFKPANPRRTVSFAPVHQIRKVSISKIDNPTSNVRQSNISFRADLPRILQAGIRPDTPERQGLRPGPPAPTPRQLALWEEDELGADGYGQGGHFERALGTPEGAQIHVNMLDERMMEIASGGTSRNPGVLGHATPGYVAAMRRQQYAKAHTSFRRPERGFPQNPCESRRRLPLSSHSKPFQAIANTK
jgi:hypothetical protein